MQILEHELEDGRFKYVQVERQENVALYTQTHRASGTIRYEVIKIKIQPEHTWPTGVTTPEKVLFLTSRGDVVLRGDDLPSSAALDPRIGEPIPTIEFTRSATTSHDEPPCHHGRHSAVTFRQVLKIDGKQVDISWRDAVPIRYRSCAVSSSWCLR